MTTADKIREAWEQAIGEQNYLTCFRQGVDTDGWVEAKVYFDQMLENASLEKYDVSTSDRFLVRPKSLSGIENNNGWIKIEPDGSNLPKEKTVCWINYENTGIICGEFRGDKHQKKFWIANATHYQPIEKPKPPLY